MDCLRISRFVLLLCGLLAFTGCSKSNPEETQLEADTRPTMAEFFEAQTAPTIPDFNSESITDSVRSANQASLSYFKHQLSSSTENNVLMTPWPMFSTLALAGAASHDETADEFNQSFNELSLNLSWPRTYHALLQSQSSLLSSGTGTIRQDLWAQFDSHFETAFLQQINPTFQANFHSTDFKAAEDIQAVVENLALQTSGENYSFDLENYANTRLFILDQIRINGTFDLNDLALESFDGLFEDESSILTRAPMLRIQGKLDYYENNELTAYRIHLSSNQLSLISIQPKAELHEYVGNNLENILETLNNSWVSQQTQAVLPILQTDSSLAGSWLIDWLDTRLLYSEELADLRNMDRQGGLYLQGLNWHHSLAISGQGIAVTGISAHAATYSPQNIYGPGYDEPIPTYGSVEFILDGFIPCSEATPDLTTGFIVIIDTETGLLHSALQLKTLDGVSEGERANCYF